MLTAQIAFWSAATALIYLDLGYPLLMWLAARLRPRPVRRSDIRPHVTILLVAQDEASIIGRRIEKLCVGEQSYVCLLEHSNLQVTLSIRTLQFEAGEGMTSVDNIRDV